MIDIQETKKVNNAMIEIMKQSLADPRIMLFPTHAVESAVMEVEV